MNMYNTKEKCMEIARRFEQLCEERGTTPYKIARYSGLSSSTVSYFLAEVHAQDEELVLYTYRNLPEDKKKGFLKLLLTS